MMPMLKTYNPAQWPLLGLAMQMIGPCASVLDVGAGLRPQRIINAQRHVCLEPHFPYAKELRAGGYPVVELPAPAGLYGLREGEFDAVVMMDVIEHMPKEDGNAALRLATKIAGKHVIVFTPLGFVEQTTDAWGMGGEYWQTHRSGWTPDEFPQKLGWRCIADPTFTPTHGAFCAIWTNPR